MVDISYHQGSTDQNCDRMLPDTVRVALAEIMRIGKFRQRPEEMENFILLMVVILQGLSTVENSVTFLQEK